MSKNSPSTPYYAVIFTSVRTAVDDGYGAMSDRMMELAINQPGFLGVDSAREEVGITVSYWESLDAIKNWKANAEHAIAQKTGREKWYHSFITRICRVEKEYSFQMQERS
ncbi:antibiotic biosynthesis monooxygenase [Kosakonia sp. H7A]|uniref:antibiotic biosynthesis monooxygenase family protein n=1 Tax=Kosakonia sp. H7A TaxID=2054598 RepID=UPI000D151792|nr:antibiotic biosynthesis monooxygenase [Kosakonia sp. H7A]PTA92025.1 antibiotic biosynthesis monooxygenase [Kosakonia sp. H7A]